MEPYLTFAAATLLAIVGGICGWILRGIIDRDEVSLEIAERDAAKAHFAPMQKAMHRAEIAGPLELKGVTQADGRPLDLRNMVGENIAITIGSANFVPPPKTPGCVLCDHSIPHEAHA